MTKKNGRQTIGPQLTEQLDGTPLDLLTAPNSPPSKNKKLPLNGYTIPESLNRGNDREEKKQSKKSAKARMTIQINEETIERVKDCVYWNRLTVAKFVEEALEKALKDAEEENGKPFQKRRTELKPGRPTK